MDLTINNIKSQTLQSNRMSLNLTPLEQTTSMAIKLTMDFILRSNKWTLEGSDQRNK